MAMTSASGSRIFREQGIGDAELLEPLGAQQARVAPQARRAILRHRHVGSERRAAELAQVELHDLVARDAHRPGDALRALELVDVALAVAEAERAQLVAFVPSDR